jgi:single-stranded-DNA-specific exonuclease
MTEKDIMPELHIDAKLAFSEISPKFIRILDQFSPFGPGNMRPTFMSENIAVVYHPRIVGSNHLVTCLKQNGNEKVFDAIGFNLGAFADRIDKEKNLIDIVYTIESLSKDGKTFPQIRIKDIQVKEVLS